MYLPWSMSQTEVRVRGQEKKRESHRLRARTGVLLVKLAYVRKPMQWSDIVCMYVSKLVDKRTVNLITTLYSDISTVYIYYIMMCLLRKLGQTFRRFKVDTATASQIDVRFVPWKWVPELLVRIAICGHPAHSFEHRSRIVSDPTQLWTVATTSPLQHPQRRLCNQGEEEDSHELFYVMWREAAILFKVTLCNNLTLFEVWFYRQLVLVPSSNSFW